MHIASIFLNIVINIIGRKFDGGPCGLPGLESGITIPLVISPGVSPVLAI